MNRRKIICAGFFISLSVRYEITKVLFNMRHAVIVDEYAIAFCKLLNGFIITF